MIYQLYYWPGIQGRGEYIRLALEEAGARYIDVARLPEKQGGGEPAILRLLEGAGLERPPFRDVVVVARPGAAELNFDELATELERTFGPRP